MKLLLQRAVVILFNLALTIAILFALEFGVRTIQTRRLGNNGLTPASYMDRWAAWRNAPGTSRIDVHINKEGFRRTSEVSLQKPPNTIRIFFLGGSAAFGTEGLFPHNLDPDWAWLYDKDLIDAWLERKLKAAHPEKNWEVINGAVVEYRMHQTLAELFTTVLRYKPDLLIFFDGHNDMSGLLAPASSPYDPYGDTPHELEFESSTYPHTLGAWFYINSQWLRNESALFALLYRRVQARTMVSGFGGGSDAGQPMHIPVQPADLSPALRARAAANLGGAGYYADEVSRISNILRHEGIPAVFSMQPELISSGKPLTPAETRFADYFRRISGPYNVYMWENLRPVIARQTAERAAKEGFDFIDLGGAFQSVQEKTFTDYCHLTPRGNEILADKLLEHITPALLPQLLQNAGK